jgi:hypothetical protein
MISEDLNQLENFLNKALALTEIISTKAVQEDFESTASLLDNRERLISVITHYHEKLMLYPNNERAEHNIQINRLSRYIDILVEKTHEIEDYLIKNKEEIQIQIAKAFKNKENLKGYNLNNVK